MKNPSFPQHNYLAYYLISLAIVFFFAITLSQVIAVFFEPTGIPPTNNTQEPINISGIGQSKSGGLILNSAGAPNGLIIDKGNVGIGTTAPDGKLHVSGGTFMAYPKPGIADFTSAVFSNNVNATIRFHHVGGLTRIHTDGGQSISLATNGENDRLTIDSSGNAAFTGNLTVSGKNVCRQDGTNCPASGLSGSGSANTLPIFTGGTSLGNSLITDNGSYYTLSSRGLYVPNSWIIANDLRTRSGFLYAGASDFEAMRGNDSWLRLNQAGQFSSGVYTPGRLRVDGDIFQGGEADANRVCRKDGTNCPPGVSSLPWASITSKPAGFADDVDNVGITSESDPTVLASVKDGVSWGELSAVPAGFADGVDNTGLGSETDPTVLTSVKDGISWGEISSRPAGLDDGDQIGLLGGGTVNFLSKFTGSGTLGNSQIFDNGTNVGIGTANPGAGLHMLGGASGVRDELRIETTAASNAARLRLINNAGGNWFVGAGALTGSADFQIDQGGAGVSEMVITTDGNVGIGMASPGQKLDVAGNVRGTGLCIGTDCKTSWASVGGVSVAYTTKCQNSGMGGCTVSCSSGGEIITYAIASTANQAQCDGYGSYYPKFACIGGTSCTVESSLTGSCARIICTK